MFSNPLRNLCSGLRLAGRGRDGIFRSFHGRRGAGRYIYGTGRHIPVPYSRFPKRAGKRSSGAFMAFAVLLAQVATLAAQDTLELSREPDALAVRARLIGALAKVPKETDVGLLVVDCDDGATWFAQQPRSPLKPASVMKLFITAAALERFGPDFTYKTRIYLRDDELLVLGGGDPGLGDERLARRHERPWLGELDDWARLLKDRGVGTLKTIALDDSIFERQHCHPDWPDDQAAAWYQAPVGGINFNDNCLDARFTASDGQVTLFLQPDLPDCFFRNKLKAAAKHQPIVTRAFELDVFEFRGPVSRDDRFKPISVRRPTVFFGYALRHALRKHGITLSGQVVRRKLTPAALAGAEPLDVHTTSLEDALWRCNTFSQNLFAECLLKSLAAYNPDGTPSGVEGSWDGGVQVLETTLRELGIELDGATFRDGSGLSHDNRVTAEQIVQLLVNMRRHRHGEFYISSLAQTGCSGTLRHTRWNTPALQDRLRGKTGSIDGVRTLAGYVRRPDGKTLAFALLINGNSPGAIRVRVANVLAEAGIDTKP